MKIIKSKIFENKHDLEEKNKLKLLKLKRNCNKKKKETQKKSITLKNA
jgi:hypothetical protein